MVNSSRELVERVSPAVARHALKADVAEVLFKEPFTIQLKPGVDSCPRPGPDPEVVYVEKQVSTTFFNPAASMLSVTKFFDQVDPAKGGDGIVWAKSLVNRKSKHTGKPVYSQVVVQFKDGDEVIGVPAISGKDPVCLSERVPFDILKRSRDLASSVARGSIKLMTHAEAEEYFTGKAKALGVSVQSVVDQAIKEVNAALQNTPLDEIEKSAPKEKRKKTEEVVTPHVLNLLEQGGPARPAHLRLGANRMIERLKELQEIGGLTETDLEYISTQASYPSVKRWAAKEIGTELEELDE